jgi:hypothetical protein
LSTYDLTIGASGVFAGYGTTSFVVTNSTGKVTQSSLGSGAAAGKQIFPIGYSAAATDYTPCTIDNTGTTRDISVYMGNGRLTSGTSGAAKTSHSVDRSWYVSSSGAGYSVTMTLQWNTARELTSFTRTNCHIGHWNGTSWDASPGESSATNVSGSIYSLSRSSITSFSPFSVDDPSALPITLIDFKAKADGANVRLDWVTGTEENNDYFTIEKSVDGITFEQVFTKKGAGNSNHTLYYVGYDAKPYKGISYYRLKQTDFDGKYAYSDMESVNFSNEDKENYNFTIYPNPVIDQTIHLSFTTEEEEEITVRISDNLGQVLYTSTNVSEKGGNHLKIAIPTLNEGIYQLECGNAKIGYQIHTIKL